MISHNIKKYISLGLFTVICTGCGLNKSNPLDDYRMLELVPEGQQISQESANPSVIIENQTYTVLDLEQAHQRATDIYGNMALQNSLYQVSTDQSLHFTEDQEATFEITVRFRVGQVKFEVEPADLPESSMSFELISQEENISRYRVQWKPSAGFIPSAHYSVTDSFKVSLKNMEYLSSNARINQAVQKAFDDLEIKSVDVSYVVRKDNNIPSLEINNLGQNLNAGEVHKFTVDVTAPPSYTSQDPLTPVVSFDASQLVNSLGLIEASGADFISIDPDNSVPERLSANKWRIHYVFDTLSRTLPLQYGRTLRAIDNFDKLYVNVSFQVDAQDKVSVSEKTILRFYIQR